MIVSVCMRVSYVCNTPSPIQPIVTFRKSPPYNPESGRNDPYTSTIYMNAITLRVRQRIASVAWIHTCNIPRDLCNQLQSE